MPHGSIARTAELVIVSLFVTCSAFADCLDFAAARAYPGFRSGLVAVADFNGDGKKDVALSSTGNLSVLLGTGDGSFSSAFDYPIGLGATGGPVAAGDFNGDGKSDLIRVDGLTTNVLIGHGDGTFSAPKPLPTGSFVMSVAIGDFNADGRSDVATITFDGQLSILLGNGDGTFAVATQYELGSIGWGVVTADLDGDGTIDIAAAAGTGVTVFLGKGNGIFTSGVSYAPGVFHPRSLDVGDLDGDGRLDLVAGAAGEGSAIAVFPGKGDGTFRAAVLTSFNDYPSSVHVADLDADGKPDVVVTGFSTMYAYRGTGRFSLDSPTTYENGAGSSFLIDDLNTDGKLDLVLGGGIMFGRGDGTFPAAAGASGGGRFLALGDFNGDGRIDIATAGSVVIGSPGVTILLGNGNGTFANPVLYSTPQLATSVAVGDMNGDGKIDLIETCQALRGPPDVFVGVQLGNGDGTFGAIQKYPLPPRQPESITIADLNGDHRNDVVVVFAGSTAVLLNQGDGTLTAPSQYTVGAVLSSAVAADFNGDGKN
ncbi:MAG: hypothetical protein QOE68_1118, partial [Thermoanaerobaculia bacterium]|nr:hypothetical protein [Thermoanaerobaculia bacterium]